MAITITLHWWMVPVGLVAFGLVCLFVDGRREGYMAGMAGAVVFLASLAAAIAFTAGHSL